MGKAVWGAFVLGLSLVASGPAHASPVAGDDASTPLVASPASNGNSNTPSDANDILAIAASLVMAPADDAPSSASSVSFLSAIPEPVPAWLMAIGLAASFIGRRLRSRLKRKDRVAPRRA